ncbi:MAG: hypothetical protein ACLGHT_09760 [Acidimicrobiia bacterium]
MAEIVDVPELHEFVKAHARATAVEQVRSEAARDLAVAAWDASQKVTPSVMAKAVGVGLTRIRALVLKGQGIVAREAAERRKKR